MPEGPGIQAVVAQQEVEDIAAPLAGYELALRRVGSMPITQSIQGILTSMMCWERGLLG